MFDSNFIKKYKDSLILAVIAIPILLIAAFVIFQIPIVDSDANTYHLFNSRLILENDLSYFSARPVDLANELGIGVSSHFPWLYSFLVAKIASLASTSLDNAAYFTNGFVYIFFILLFPSKARPFFALVMLMPSAFAIFFLSGTNYYLTVFFAFLLYRTIQEGGKIWVILIASLFLSQTHVLGYYLGLLIILCSCFRIERKQILYLFSLVGILSVAHFYWNYRLTGSPTFPFLQNFFPHHNYNEIEWNLVQMQITKAIFATFAASSIISISFYYLKLIGFSLIVNFSLINTRAKLVIYLFMLPVFLLPYFGMRHRIIFGTIALSVFLYEVFANNLNYVNKLFKIYSKNASEINCLVLIFICSSMIIRNSGFEHTEADFSDVKQCYYQTIDRLTENHVLMMSETELLRIRNYKNIVPVDGANLDRYFGGADIENAKALFDSDIKYIATSPLSEPLSKFVEHDKLFSALSVLNNNSQALVYKDCVYDSGFNQTYIDKKAFKDGWYGWKIFEIVR